VVGVDVDEAKLALIRDGRTPVVEEGMIELMDKAAKSGRVTVTTRCRRPHCATPSCR
jgi:GDP-mannose 6-dehydrogenase